MSLIAAPMRNVSYRATVEVQPALAGRAGQYLVLTFILHSNTLGGVAHEQRGCNLPHLSCVEQSNELTG